MTEWCVGYQVEFLDGGPPVACVLGFDTEEKCTDAIAKLPVQTVPYSGPRPVYGAQLFACPTTELTRA